MGTNSQFLLQSMLEKSVSDAVKRSLATNYY